MDFRDIFLGIMSVAGLAWRFVDPKGSYAALFDTAYALSVLVAANEYLAQLFSLVLVDEVTGFLIGILFVAILKLILIAVKYLLAQPQRWLT